MARILRRCRRARPRSCSQRSGIYRLPAGRRRWTWRRVTDDLHVIYGLGSNVGVLRTEEGSGGGRHHDLHPPGPRDPRAGGGAGGTGARAVVNTHYHLDHTHGNPAFSKGQNIYATEPHARLSRRAGRGLLVGRSGQGTAAQRDCSAASGPIELGGKTVRLIEVGRGHTDGDLVVLFVEDRVVHTGDLFFNGRYPNIDLEAGGSVKRLVRQRSIESSSSTSTRSFPATGRSAMRTGLRSFQRFMGQLADISRATRERHGLHAGRDPGERRSIDADAGYDVMAIPFDDAPRPRLRHSPRLGRGDRQLRARQHRRRLKRVRGSAPHSNGREEAHEGSVLHRREGRARHRRIAWNRR